MKTSTMMILFLITAILSIFQSVAEPQLIRARKIKKVGRVSSIDFDGSASIDVVDGLEFYEDLSMLMVDDMSMSYGAKYGKKDKTAKKDKTKEKKETKKDGKTKETKKGGKTKETKKAAKTEKAAKALEKAVEVAKTVKTLANADAKGKVKKQKKPTPLTKRKKLAAKKKKM